VRPYGEGMWRMSSPDGRRWVQYDGPGRVSASGGLDAYVTTGLGPVEVNPLSGVFYEPKGADDEVAVFLRARAVVGDNAPTVTGTPPKLPAFGSPPASPGVVY
jgi:hypothetical protein